MARPQKRKRTKQQYKRQNERIKEYYDRVSITLPKGTKERIREKGETLNGYITRLVLANLGEVSEAEPVEDQQSSNLSDVPFM